MRWYVSYPILAAGLAFGADTFFPGERSSAHSLAEARPAVPSAPASAPEVLMASELEALPASRLADFSPGAVLAAARPAQKSVLDYLAQTLTPAVLSPSAAVAATPAASGATWTSAVIRVAHGGADMAPPPARPDTPASRGALARDIQRELRRVGCYLGEIDGVWGRGSKRATLAFMDRVNASLPTQDPDVFVLSLLRAHSGPVCGSSCPRGQSTTASGRCLPSALVAQAESPAPGVRPSAPRAMADIARSELAPHRRMGIGGPKADDIAPLASDWTGADTSTVTSRPTTFARTAALETLPIAPDEADVPARPRVPKATRTSFEPGGESAAERRAKAARAKAARQAPSRRGTYRHVQHLFEHPLGRM